MMLQDRVYAVPARATQLQPFAAEVRKARATEFAELEADAPRRPPPSSMDTKYVKLLAPNMSRQKLGPVPPAASAQLPSNALCVAVHDVWHCAPRALGGETPIAVYVEPKELHSLHDHLAVLALCDADVSVLKEGMLAYSAKAGLMYNVEGLSRDVAADTEHMIRDLVLNNAFPEAVSGLRVPPSNTGGLQALATLEALDIISSVLEGHERVWRFVGLRACMMYPPQCPLSPCARSRLCFCNSCLAPNTQESWKQQSSCATSCCKWSSISSRS